MPTNTYVALDKVTLGSNTASVTFNSIPSTYTDLVIVANLGATTTPSICLQFNSDTGSNYSMTNLYGNGSTVTSSRQSNQTQMNFNFVDPGTSIVTTAIYQIMNYANSTKYKTALGRFSNAGTGTQATAGLWRSTAAITSVKLMLDSSGPLILAGSTFSLYGIRAEGVSPAAKATGGTIYSDDLYYYHVFGSTGTFTPLQSISADVLVVAGGGGGSTSGSNRSSGGGGAGGLLAYTSQSLTATGYTCTVGAGGGSSANGSNSQFAALTASVGGGRGGAPGAFNANSGGSGGGGADNNSAGAGTSGQGSAGGGGFDPGSGSAYSGGGGGGATAVGGTAASNSGGTGGTGSSAYSSWSSATGISSTGVFATGGRGGSSTTTATNGEALTGNGGTGAFNNGTIGSGGSGVVIVRYLKA